MPPLLLWLPLAAAQHRLRQHMRKKRQRCRTATHARENDPPADGSAPGERLLSLSTSISATVDELLGELLMTEKSAGPLRHTHKRQQGSKHQMRRPSSSHQNPMAQV